MILRWFIKIQVLPVLPLFFKLKLAGRKNAKFKGRAIIMSNHISTWDAVLLFCVFWKKTLYYMTASILFSYNKLFSWFIKNLGALKVERKSTDLGAIDTAIKTLENNKNLVIFPEGLRSLDGDMLPFRPGIAIIALTSKSPIIPVYIGGKYGFFSRVKMAIGEPIDLAPLYGDKQASEQDIMDICQMLREKIIQLSEKV